MRIKITNRQNQIFISKFYSKSSLFEFNETAVVLKDSIPISLISVVLNDIGSDGDILLPQWFSNVYSINENTCLDIDKLPSFIPTVSHIKIRVVEVIDLLDIQAVRKEINSLEGIINHCNVYVASYGKQVLISIECEEASTIFKTNKQTRISFSGYGVTSIQDIGGQPKLIEWYKEHYLFSLIASSYYKKWRIPTPRGILLSGKPGLGKTHFLKAIIADCGVYFINVSATQIITPLAGEGDETLEKVFKEARHHAPTIICIDEIEALCLNRSSSNANYENRVVTVFLKEMDGLDTRSDVLVIGTTNRPDIIDSAFLRPGRFTYQIELTMPDENARLEIIKIHTRYIDHNITEEQLREIGRKSDGLTGAEIADKIHKAAIHSIRSFFNDNCSGEPILDYEILSNHF